MPPVWLDEIADGDRDRVGAKAFSLSRLRKAGLPAPDGFVVPAEDADPAPADLEEACARLGRVAVRSSAAGEDSAEASFAGQYRTELDVRGAAEVAAAVHRCRRSRAGEYAAAMAGTTASAPRHEERTPVLVQAFVEPRHA